MEAELKLEKQRSMSEEAQKTRQIEAAEAIPLEVKAEALENEAHGPDSLQQILKMKSLVSLVRDKKLRKRSNLFMYLKIP